MRAAALTIHTRGVGDFARRRSASAWPRCGCPRCGATTCDRPGPPGRGTTDHRPGHLRGAAGLTQPGPARHLRPQPPGPVPAGDSTWASACPDPRSWRAGTASASDGPCGPPRDHRDRAHRSGASGWSTRARSTRSPARQPGSPPAPDAPARPRAHLRGRHGTREPAADRRAGRRVAGQRPDPGVGRGLPGSAPRGSDPGRSLAGRDWTWWPPWPWRSPPTRRPARKRPGVTPAATPSPSGRWAAARTTSTTTPSPVSGFADQVAEVSRLRRAGRREEAADAVPLELGARTNLVGTPDAIAARLGSTGKSGSPRCWPSWTGPRPAVGQPGHPGLAGRTGDCGQAPAWNPGAFRASEKTTVSASVETEVSRDGMRTRPAHRVPDRPASRVAWPPLTHPSHIGRRWSRGAGSRAAGRGGWRPPSTVVR